MTSTRESDQKVDIIIDSTNESADMPAGSAGEQGSTERLLRARGAAARSAGPPAGSNQSGDDTDDDVPDDSQSPLFVWLSMLVRTVLSAFHTAFSALLFALYPIYVIVPSFVLEGLFKAVFRVGYLVYLTPLGGWLHMRGLRPNQPPHSVPAPPAQLTTATVITVPIMDNNYAYLLIDKATKSAAVVDPADPFAVLRAVEMAGCTLTHVLTTHHHHDHAGGNWELCRRVQLRFGRKLVVVGGKTDSVPACTLPVSDGQSVKVGETEVLVLETPCHTRGHVLFCVTSGKGSSLSDAEAVFSGDTVFIGGVGAFFHGNARDMEANLNKRMAALPDGAMLFCGHEYTVDNLRFAAWLEPDSMDVIGRFLLASAKRNTGEPTVPSLLGWERRTNPYFRGGDLKLKKAVLARAEWLDRRRKLSLAERAFNAVRGRGFDRTRLQAEKRRKSVGKADPPRPSVNEENVSSVVIYEKLQLLLSSGAWQSFKLGAGAAAAARMRAASQLFPVGGAPAAPGMSAPYRPPQPAPAAPAPPAMQLQQQQQGPQTGGSSQPSLETREAVAALLGAAAMGSL